MFDESELARWPMGNFEKILTKGTAIGTLLLLSIEGIWYLSLLDRDTLSQDQDC
jgi:hypothetical protein